jgi:hypothetical protein
VRKIFKKGLLVGLINLFVSFALNFIFQGFIPTLTKEYQNPGLFRPWSDPLMRVYFLYPFVLGIVLAYFWKLISNKFTGSPANKALQFTKIYFIIASIPGMFISYTSFPISSIMVLTWLIAGVLQVYIAGLIFAKKK